jgi:hypothetical protein
LATNDLTRIESEQHHHNTVGAEKVSGCLTSLFVSVDETLHGGAGIFSQSRRRETITP